MDDLLIRGGHVIDGSGAASREADVAIGNGRITVAALPETSVNVILQVGHHTLTATRSAGRPCRSATLPACGEP